MHREATQARLQLEAWRTQGADRHDPVRFAFMHALLVRTEQVQGAPRRLLDEKLAGLLDAYAAALPDARAGAAKPSHVAGGLDQRQAGPLAELVMLLGRHARPADAPTSTLMATSAAASPDALPVLEEFRTLWTRVRSERQVRHTLEHAPVGAGPLNSVALAHRAITLMQSLSPGYLQQFLAYVDTLSWLEQMQDRGVLTASNPSRAAPIKKPTRSRARGKRAAAPDNSEG
ncbi:MAG: DUF2894 domain-containing protein [Pseudoxanthomonas sp.]